MRARVLIYNIDMYTNFFTLKNGLRVMLIDTQSFPSASTLLLIGAGSRYENAKNNGIAHFFEHMAFKGSKKYPTAHKISSIVDGLGGMFNAYTSKDHTGYYIKAPTRHFDLSLDVIADMIQHSLLDQAEIEKEKGVIVEEINMIADNPSRQVWDVYGKLLYGEHPLGRLITGTKDTVTKFDQKTFTDYMKSLYGPDNAVLVVAGGLTHGDNSLSVDHYKEEIEKRFADWKPVNPPKYEDFTSTQKKPMVSTLTKKTEQMHFSLGFRSFSFSDSRRYSLEVLSAILGSGMSSRLFSEIREKRGLAYYIYSYVDSYHDNGSLSIHAGVRANKEDLSLSVELILAEFDKLKSGDLKSEELTKVKELIKGNLVLSLEDTYSVANFYGDQLLLEDKKESPEEFIAKIDAVTAEEVFSVAQDIVDRQGLNLAVVGDVKETDVKEMIE